MSSLTTTVTSFHMIHDRLLAQGYTARELPMYHEYFEFTAPNGKKWLTKKALITYPFVSVAAAKISRNKRLSYEFAALHGVSVAPTLYFPEQQDAAEKFLYRHAPVVVKPLESFGSHGLTLDIRDDNTLQAAIEKAQVLNKNILIQQQFRGEEIRFMIVDGKVVSCIARQSPRVIGDGVSTIKELIAAENQARSKLGFKIVPYPQLDTSLVAPELLTSDKVPSKNEVVLLNSASMVRDGASMLNIIDDIHPSYKEVALDLGKALNPAFVAVDLLITDYTKPLTENNYIFLEFSLAPSLRLFYDVRYGKDYDVVAKVVEMIHENLR